MSRGLRLKQNGVGEQRAEGDGRTDGRTATERGRKGCLRLRKGPQVPVGAPGYGHTGKAMAGQTLSKGQERGRDIRQKEARGVTRALSPVLGEGSLGGERREEGKEGPSSSGPTQPGLQDRLLPRVPPEPGPLAPVCYRPQPEARPGRAWGQHRKDPEWRPLSSTGSRAASRTATGAVTDTARAPRGLTSGRWQG